MKPPELVETVLIGVMILRTSDPSWAEEKRQLGDTNFIKSLVNFDRDNISDKTLKRIGQICAKPDFKPDIVGRVSFAARSLCMWVRAMEVYGHIYRVVEPKKKVKCDKKQLGAIMQMYMHVRTSIYLPLYPYFTLTLLSWMRVYHSVLHLGMGVES